MSFRWLGGDRSAPTFDRLSLGLPPRPISSYKRPSSLRLLSLSRRAAPSRAHAAHVQRNLNLCCNAARRSARGRKGSPYDTQSSSPSATSRTAYSISFPACSSYSCMTFGTHEELNRDAIRNMPPRSTFSPVRALLLPRGRQLVLKIPRKGCMAPT